MAQLDLGSVVGPAGKDGKDGITSFNGRTGEITPQADDYTAEMVKARPDTWLPTAEEIGAAQKKHTHDVSEITGYSAEPDIPIDHASAETTYGVGTSSLYGHVKLSDNISDISAASNGIAATPKAVKAELSAHDTDLTSHVDIRERIVNRNMLINYDFTNPVNRNGRTEYTATGYTVDRWMMGRSCSKVEVTNAGVRLTGSDTSGYSAFYFDIPVDYTGRKLTASILLSDGNLFTMGGLVGEGQNIGVSANLGANFSFNLQHFPSGPFTRFNIYGAPGITTDSTITLVAAKLEFGDTQTLAHKEGDRWVLNEPSNYAEQYTLCSQYSPTTGEFIGAQHSNEQMLDNSRWDVKENIVNQRNETEYTKAGYTIDRWVIGGGSTNLKISDDGIYLTALPSAYTSLTQFIEGLDSYLGKTLTLSVMTTDKKLFVCTTTLPTTMTAFDAPNSNIEEIGYIDIYANANYVDKNIFSVRLVALSGQTLGFRAAKLELGPVQTLAHQENGEWVLNDPPPNYALELAKCQRYYRKYPAIIGHQFYPNAVSLPIDISNMRETPTMTVGRVNLPGGEDLTVTGINVDNKYNPYVVIAEVSKDDVGRGVYVNDVVADAEVK